MLLKITTTHVPATDLGYLLHKHPGRVQEFDVGFGKAHVFYPKASEEECTAALVVEVDPIRLVRSVDPNQSAPLQQYVNDRPFVTSSFLSVALGRVFSTAISGNCKQRPELAETSIPLVFEMAAVSARGGARFLRAVFEPLGYEVECEPIPLDPELGWEDSFHHRVKLSGSHRLSDALSHLYVLLPVLDDSKHYWVDQDEVEKLLRHGEGWLTSHPQKDEITRRYLERRRHLVYEALDRLTDDSKSEEDEVEASQSAEVLAAKQRRQTLHDARLDRVADLLTKSGALSVLDLGCGEGKLLKRLLTVRQFTQITGMDVSHRALEIAARRLRMDEFSNEARARLKLIHGSLLYRDSRLEGFDAAAVVEVIEHLDESRLESFERNVFEFARPGLVILTTPNVEYNALFENMTGFRHDDHRFEWTRKEFAEWAEHIAQTHKYTVEIEGVGEPHEEFGSPSQLAMFRRGA